MQIVYIEHWGINTPPYSSRKETDHMETKPSQGSFSTDKPHFDGRKRCSQRKEGRETTT